MALDSGTMGRMTRGLPCARTNGHNRFAGLRRGFGDEPQLRVIERQLIDIAGGLAISVLAQASDDHINVRRRRNCRGNVDLLAEAGSRNVVHVLFTCCVHDSVKKRRLVSRKKLFFLA